MDVESVLKKYGLTPKHIFGQNFMIDENVLDRIVACADIQPGSIVIEIGPGVGNLTRKLLEKGAKVLTIEKDENFKPILRKLAKEFPGHLEMVWGDALKIQEWKVKSEEWKGGNKYKIVGNIPYYITGKLLPLLLNFSPSPENITLLVQKEVAERMVAKPGQMSLLSLAVQLKSEPTLEFVVPAKAFYPAPKVDSAVVRLNLSASVIPVSTKEPLWATAGRPESMHLNHGSRTARAGVQSDTALVASGMTISLELEKQIFKLAKAGFRGKRKTLLNTLSGNLGFKKTEVEKLLKDSKIDPQTRPQELSIENWLSLAKSFNSK